MNDKKCAAVLFEISTDHTDIRDVTKDERKKINKIGDKFGDHHNPEIKDSGLKSGWTPDHQPVTKLVLKAQEVPQFMELLKEAKLPTTLVGQRLFAHSGKTSRSQGGITREILRNADLLRKCSQETV